MVTMPPASCFTSLRLTPYYPAYAGPCCFIMNIPSAFDLCRFAVCKHALPGKQQLTNIVNCIRHLYSRIPRTFQGARFLFQTYCATIDIFVALHSDAVKQQE